MKITLNKGFTLIELLVVITIIGVLATGAVGIYTSQLQKARDSTRLNDIQSLNTSLQAIYNDTSEFPTPGEWNDATYGIQKYISVTPGDPKHARRCASSAATTPYCGYAYVIGQDSNGVADGAYELSTGFEHSGNITGKAANANDNGNDADRYEIGTLVAGTTSTDLVTAITAAPAAFATTAKGVCLPTATAAGNVTATTVVLINGNPTGANDCG